jgi:3-phosphoglycerate kinase
VKFILPTDVVLADKFAADANTKVVSVDAIPDGWMGLDNGVRARVHIHVCVHIHAHTHSRAHTIQ